MSMMKSQAEKRHVRKLCMLLLHDENFSKEDVVVNVEHFQELGLVDGSVAQLMGLKHGTAVRDFQNTGRQRVLSRVTSAKWKTSKGTSRASDKLSSMLDSRTKRNSSAITTLDETGKRIDGSREVDPYKSYVCVVKEATTEQKRSQPRLEISLSATVAKVFGFRNRMQVMISTIDEALHSASHVELTFRDEYLSRADMWRMATSEMSQKSVYQDQKLLFMGTIKATVKNVYVSGQKTRSAYFSASTKPIFRSESARYVLFIQMSKEMWEFDAEGSGDIMFNKVVDELLPELFKRWTKLNARHLVTIVLFARLEYETPPDGFEPFHKPCDIGDQYNSHSTRDFYRVVVNEMASGEWINILNQLKKEFKAFLHEVSIIPNPTLNQKRKTTQETAGGCDVPEYVIAGSPLPACKGNILEAISLASFQFSKDHIDRDLVRTGISVVVISAGSGVFEVDHNLLRLTTDTLVGNGIGIDLVCLSPMPLHSVPLFKYRAPQTSISTVSDLSAEGPVEKSRLSSGDGTQTLDGADTGRDDWCYAMPHWIDISFWAGSANSGAKRQLAIDRKGIDSISSSGPFALRCRMYELQMMGVMENELSNISVEYMHKAPFYALRQGRYNGQLLHSSTRSHQDHAQNDRTARPGTVSVSPSLRERELLERSSHSSKEHEKASVGHFMNKYDEGAFHLEPQRQHTDVEDRAKRQKHTGSVSQRVEAEDSLLQPFDVSQRPKAGAIGPTTQHGKGYLDWKFKKRPTSPTPVTPRKDSLSSSATAVGSLISGPSKLSRQTSFGAPSFGTAKAVASTGSPLSSKELQSLEALEPVTNRKPKPDHPTQRQDALAYTRQVRSKLVRHASHTSTLSSILASSGSVDSHDDRSPAQTIASNAGDSRDRDQLSSAETVSGSCDTVKDVSRLQKDGMRHARDTPYPESLILYAASSARRVGPRPELPVTNNNERTSKVSQQESQSPWLVLVNPCNPKKNTANGPSQFRRWQHVFPRPLQASTIKWKSLCSPAALPLTNEFFPTAEQLAAEYHESPYEVFQSGEEETDFSKSREALVRELIAVRLSHGFQLVVGAAVAEFLGSRECDLANIFDKSYMAHDGARVFMTVGNTIHQLSCLAGGGVEIRRFKRKPPTTSDSSLSSVTSLTYRPLIRTALARKYERRDIHMGPSQDEHNWNAIDTFLAGCDHEFSESLRFWRARFVLIPVELPSHSRSLLPPLTEDSEEEVRLEGIRRLTQMWQRYRILSPEERRLQPATQKGKDPNPLAIEYQTRDPSAVVAAGPDSSLLAEGDPNVFSTQLFAEVEPYQTSNIDMQKLAQDLQGDKGIRMLDRRWHWRLHYSCFVGTDLTNWLLQNFRDIQTREEAVNLGNHLMNRGLFQHVQRKHQFRDGNYFYQIASEYRASRIDSRMSWFGRRSDKSVPSTPMPDAKHPPVPSSLKSRPNTEESSSGSGERTPTKANETRRTVTLSRVMRYNVDHRKRSYRPEIINLHYDRLHNPDNCYHIRIDWMNVTAKLIEDAIVTWATLVERYGLKLVEVPIAEASSVGDNHPFRSPYRIKLAVPPPQVQPQQYFDTTSFTPQPPMDKFAYHKALLRRLDFVLDVESTASFPSDANVTYSWGKPDYRYTQYIHRSGVLLAQITDDGDLLLLANRLCNNRAAAARDTYKFDKMQIHLDRRPVGAINRSSDRWSPFSSPLVRAVPEQIQNGEHSFLAQKIFKTPEQIARDVEKFCSNSLALNAFYQEASKPRPSPSPRSTPVLDSTIPALGLPPNMNIRDASLSPAVGNPTRTMYSSGNPSTRASSTGNLP